MFSPCLHGSPSTVQNMFQAYKITTYMCLSVQVLLSSMFFAMQIIQIPAITVFI